MTCLSHSEKFHQSDNSGSECHQPRQKLMIIWHSLTEELAQGWSIEIYIQWLWKFSCLPSLSGEWASVVSQFLLTAIHDHERSDMETDVSPWYREDVKNKETTGKWRQGPDSTTLEFHLLPYTPDVKVAKSLDSLNQLQLGFRDFAHTLYELFQSILPKSREVGFITAPILYSRKVKNATCLKPAVWWQWRELESGPHLPFKPTLWTTAPHVPHPQLTAPNDFLNGELCWPSTLEEIF